MNAVLPLRLALIANAVFSLVSAVIILFYPEMVGEWLGIQAPLVLQAVGIGLAGFAAALIYLAIRKRIIALFALLASIADFLWVAVSFVVLLVFPGLFSSLGSVLILAVAVTVLAFGVWQLWAIGHAHKSGWADTYRHCIIVETNVPSEKIWQVIGNLGEIKKYVPSLKRSFVVGGETPGIGVVRTCEDQKGKRWSEICTEYKVGQGYTVRFLSEQYDFPFPVKEMHGGWEVTSAYGGSQVMVWWELTPKYKLLAPVIISLLAFQADREFPQIIKRMAATSIESDSRSQVPDTVIARLLPVFC